MSSALYQSIELLSNEKNIDPQIVVTAVEEAIALATRKFYKTQENMRGELNKETGEITAYVYKTVIADDEEVEDTLNTITLSDANELAPGVELGSEIRLYKDTSPLGRIAAQLAKQVIFQKVREAERDNIFQEYAHREKEVLNATVKRVEGQDVIFDIGKAEARCPKREQSRLETSPLASVFASSSSRLTAPPRVRRSSSRAPLRNSSRTSSRPRSLKFTTTP